MKKLAKIFTYVLVTAMVLLVSQSTVFAASDSSNQNSLTGIQIFGGFAVLVLVIILPLLKRSNKHETI